LRTERAVEDGRHAAGEREDVFGGESCRGVRRRPGKYGIAARSGALEMAVLKRAHCPFRIVEVSP